MRMIHALERTRAGTNFTILRLRNVPNMRTLLVMGGAQRDTRKPEQRP